MVLQFIKVGWKNRKFQGFFSLILIMLFFNPLDLFPAELVGRVFDSRSRTPISGATLRAIPQQSQLREVRHKTDADGKYHLELMRGSYRLYVAVPDSNYWPRFYSKNGNEWGDLLQIPSFDSFLSIDIPLVAGGAISGSVRRLPDGKALPDVHIYAETANSRISTKSRNDGSYHLRPLLPGEYRVHIATTDENYIPLYFDGRQDARKADPIPLGGQEEITGIDFELEVGGMVRGRITAKKSFLPLAGAKVIAEKVRSQDPLRFTFADAQGYYSLRGLTEGKYILECELKPDNEATGLPGKVYLTQYFDHALDSSLHTSLTIQAGSVLNDVNFELMEESRISGRVYSQLTNEPLKNVEIRPYPIEAETISLPVGHTSSQGEYLIDRLPPGQYRLETLLSKPNQQYVRMFYRNYLSPGRADILELLEGNWIHNINFLLMVGGTIRGMLKVDDSNYKVSPGSFALQLKVDGTDFFDFGEREYPAQSDGTFTINGIPAGHYRLMPLIKDPYLFADSETGPRSLALSEGAEIEGVEFSFKLGGSISGSVTIQDSSYESNKLALILINLKEKVEKVYPLKSEQYSLNGLAPGKYVVSLATLPETMTPDHPIPKGRYFENRFVEVLKGSPTKGVDFLIKSPSIGLPTVNP